MKEYLKDQAIELVILICMFLACPLAYTPEVTLVARILIVYSILGLDYRLILFPLDLICGKKSEIVYYESGVSSICLEFSKGKFCPQWKFTYGQNRLILLVPIVMTDETIQQLERPVQREKITITYYRFSKILLSYQSSTQGTVDFK